MPGEATGRRSATRSHASRRRARRTTFARGLCAAATAVAALMLAAPAHAVDYVAMGDSYSSGTGTATYFDSTCLRSNLAYGPLIKGQFGTTFTLAACSGAVANQITTNTQNGNPPQVDKIDASTKYVSISIGGNDAGFVDTLLECGKPGWMADCDGKLAGSRSIIANTLPGRYDTVFTRIRQKAPNAKVVFVGYPHLFPANGDDCNAVTFFSPEEIVQLNAMADLLSDTARAAARRNHVAWVDARAAFTGHAWCEDEWINGLSVPSTDESFHPNVTGHAQGYQGIVAAALKATPAPGATTGPNGRIAFASTRDGNSEIYAVNADGRFPTNLTRNPASDVDPAVSPDGTRIAFASNRRDGQVYDLYAMNVDGSGLTQLTSSSLDDREPAWSPNGESLVFRSNRTGNDELWRVPAAGGTQTRLTQQASSISSSAPAWSPDGAEIAFQRSSASTGVQIYKMNANGQGQINLTGSAATVTNGHPAWSPDGSRIAFHSNRSDGRSEIFTMGPTGGTATRLTNVAGGSRQPVYSPDGSQLAFVSARAGGARVFTMTATGGAQTQRTATATDAADATPAWQGDQTPPQTTLLSGPSGTVGTATPTFAFDADELGATFACRVDGATYAACSSPLTVAPLADGPHTFSVRATDPSGNTGPAATRTFSTYTEGSAATAITEGPSGPTADAAPRFAFANAASGMTFACRVDAATGGLWAPCTSPVTLSGLVEGAHTFEVRGTDPLGTVEAAPPVRAFLVDRTAPRTELSFAPPVRSADPDPRFAFAADEPGARFECRHDDAAGAGAWAACASPWTLHGLADGEHTVRVRAIDQAGNVEPVGVVHAFAVDRVAPVATISGGPAGTAAPVRVPETTFTFAVDEPGARTECRLDSLDDGDWAACVSPRTLTGLAHGVHVFQVRAVDEAGNVQAVAAQSGFGVSLIAPDPVFLTVPEGVSDTPRPTVRFSSPDPEATFACRVDSEHEADWAPCDSPLPFVGGTPGVNERAELADGPHTLDLRATGAFGDVRTAPRRSWTVRTLALTQVPAARSTDADPELRFASTRPGVSFACRVDATPAVPCTSPFVARGLTDGPHAFTVTATGPGAHVATATHAWTVDATLPAVTFGDAPAGVTRSTRASAAFAADRGPVTFSCRLDDAATWTACASPWTAEGLGEGAHTLRVRATDDLDRTGLAAVRTWTVDTVAPELRLDAGPAPRTAQRSAVLTFSSAEPAAFTCAVDGAPAAPCASPLTVNGLADGEHAVELRAVDAAGNVTTLRHAWTVDTVRPAVTLAGGPASPTSARGATFASTADEAVAGWECALDAGAWTPCAAGRTVDGLADGPHAFRVRATDLAGNVSAPAAHAWTVDTVSPGVVFEVGPASGRTASDGLFEFIATEAAARFACALDGAAPAACAPPYRIAGLAAGDHVLEVRATDEAGNAGPAARWAWTVAAPAVAPEPDPDPAPDPTPDPAPPGGTAPPVLPPVVPPTAPRPSIAFTGGTQAVSRSGTATVARLTCGTGRCRVTVPRRVTLRVRGHAYAVRVSAPATVRAGATGKVTLLVPASGARALRGRTATVALKVALTATDGTRVARTTQVRVKGR